jgi:LmbE family N-acetylglucosaminyl deacetylase
MSGRRKVALVVVAHADDLEYNVGGTIARFVAEGYDVYRAAVTDSARGTFDRDITVEKMVEIGIAEAKAAGRVLGLKGDFFLGFPDGMLTDVHVAAIREQLMRIVRQLQVDVLFTWDPWASRDDHPDHVVAGRCARWATEFATFPLVHPEHFAKGGVEPRWVTERYYFAKHPLPEADHVVDISEHLEAKIESLLKYESQMRLAYDGYVAYQRMIGVPPEEWPKPVSPDNYRRLMAEAIRREAKEFGQPHGIPYAEVFRYVRNEPRYP